MSRVVEDWVWHECPIEDSRPRFVLLAIARHCANDDGTGAYPSINRLARMVRADRKTVMRSIEQLEEVGQLLVRRPAVAGKNRPNRYTVVMGRNLDDVRRLEEERHRPAPSKLARPATERSPASATERLVPGPDPVPTRSRPGPDPVRRHAHRRTGSEGEGEGERASAARSSPARAPGLDSRLDPLRAELDGIDVSWHMTDEQATAVAALLEVHGPRSLAAVALDLMTERGRPTYARAWLGEWRHLPLPGGTVRASDVPSPRVDSTWCGSCDSPSFRFVVDDDGRPLHPCACHPTSRQPAPF
jgi:hypothetical protein